jgi:DNA-binding NarL/FixJ family response regulator
VAGSQLTVEIAIGDPELAERVRDILLGRRGFEVVTADHGRVPGVLVTDSTEELVDRLVDAAPVLLLGDAAQAAAALRMGATAVLPPGTGARMLLAAIRAAALGLTTLPTDFRHALIEGVLRTYSESEDDAPGLTTRELQVLQLLAGGASNKEIARRLRITPHTAKFHVAAIAGKLGASGRTDAVAKAMRLGLIMV